MYKIMRYFASGRAPYVVSIGLTLEAAREHCKSPDSSSRTCTSDIGQYRTRQHGRWFDGYEEQDGDEEVEEGEE
jgi:hypothetical protein